ncbi:hypothetical protein E0L36_24715 [Streptomyces sp. AJS327]|uniref:hypothetical protein n=1 Tax=Streptomyces sp. AJS327 TaxID=2545265 RepID=UPI0015DD6D51|nr:hypothetical protein [Streptomyces sp. AJS327]MBA0053936.1 hypothetical protein [Streptomyces sp. AJS327]
MDPIVLAASTALVSAMATDSWEQVRTAVTAWWGRVRPGREDGVDTDLTTLRGQVLAARQEPDPAAAERELVAAWRARLQRLLAEGPEESPEESPALAGELARLLEERLVPVLPPEEREPVRRVVQHVDARDSARVYVAGRDQHITEA